MVDGIIIDKTTSHFVWLLDCFKETTEAGENETLSYTYHLERQENSPVVTKAQYVEVMEIRSLLARGSIVF